MNQVIEKVIDILENNLENVVSASLSSVEYKDGDKSIEINIDDAGVVNIICNTFDDEDCYDDSNISFHILELDDALCKKLFNTIYTLWVKSVVKSRTRTEIVLNKF